MQIASGFLILLILKISFNYTILLNILKILYEIYGKGTKTNSIKT